MGYPEWWDDLQKRRAATKAPASRTGGKANLSTADPPTSCQKSGELEGWSTGEGEATVTSEHRAKISENQKWEERGERRATTVSKREGKGTPNYPKDPQPPFYNQKTLTLTSHPSQPLFFGPSSKPRPICSSSPQPSHTKCLLSHNTHSQWIFDCGASDTMTFDPNDLLYTHPTNRTHIQTANGACVPVAKAGAVNISSSLHLKNCLLILNLSHKLLSVSQLTKDLNCTVF